MSERIHEGPHDGSYAEQGCYGCRLKTINIGTPRDFPSRTRTDKPPHQAGNSYEAGIPTDSRGMPFIGGPDNHVMHQREVDQKRHLIEEQRKRNRQTPASP